MKATKQLAQLTPKDAIKPVREALNQHLQLLAAKLGVAIETVGSCTYGNTTLKYKVQVLFPVNGKIEKPEVTYFRQYATMRGLKPEDLGKQFSYRGHAYTITGLKLGRGYRVLATRDDGGEWRFDATVVRQALAHIDFNDPQWRFEERVQQFLTVNSGLDTRRSAEEAAKSSILDEIDKANAAQPVSA